MDEGEPISYLVLARETPVYASDGELVGKVKKVLCEPQADIFDGFELSTPEGVCYVPAEHVAAIHEHGVDLSITPAQTAQLPPPAHRPRVKWDLDRPPPHLWNELEDWLLEHLPHGHPAREPGVRQARKRLRDREHALRLARENPQLAAEVGIGRPDLPGAYDWGVVDVNHASLEVIATLPGIDERVAQQIVQARDRISGFASLEEFGMILDLQGDEVERLRQHVVFLPD